MRNHFPSSLHLWKCRSERRRRSEAKLGKTEAGKKVSSIFRSSGKVCHRLSYRIQGKVKGIGFEFASVEDAWKKVDEELAEFHAETNPEKKEQELGDVFFSLINYARISGLNADSALERTNLNSSNVSKNARKIGFRKEF